jgi:hypothetical protein
MAQDRNHLEPVKYGDELLEAVSFEPARYAAWWHEKRHSFPDAECLPQGLPGEVFALKLVF